MTPAAAPLKGSSSRVLTGECGLGECRYCRPGEIRTSYGDLVATIRCDHSCHRKDRKR